MYMLTVDHQADLKMEGLLFHQQLLCHRSHIPAHMDILFKVPPLVHVSQMAHGLDMNQHVTEVHVIPFLV